MDIARPELVIAKRRRRLLLGAVLAGTVVAIALGVWRIERAAPTVDASTVWIDTVRRGDMVREVRGTGTLVPEEIRLVAPATEGRVERMLALPGAIVEPDTVLIELSNEELQLQALEAESQYRAAVAQLAEARARLEAARLDQQATAARVASEARQARMRAEAEAELASQGLVAALTAHLSAAAADELEARARVEAERLRLVTGSVDAHLAVARAALDQRSGMADLRRSQRDALHVRAGIAGVLQSVLVEVGQRVAPGTNLARVVQPARLKAVVRIPETLAKDVRLGLTTIVDTRGGTVKGRVVRIDPAAQGGTVAVDVTFDGAVLPRGSRPELTVDATIEIERLQGVLHVGRPAQAAEQATLGLFRIGSDGYGRRTTVQIGRASVNRVEVRSGLSEGDRVVLSDTEAWDGIDLVRFR